MQETGYINSAISSNREMFQQMKQPAVASNKAHLVNSYYGDKVIYYNDEVAIKKEKNKKRNKILTLAFTGVAGVGIIGSLAVGVLKGKIRPKAIGKQVAESNFGKATKKFFDPIVNASVNFSNVKDDLWTRYTRKNKHINKVNQKLENVYHGFAKQKYKANYEKNYKVITDTFGDVKGLKNFDSWFDDMLTGIRDSLGLSDTSKQTQITEGLLTGFKEKPLQTLREAGKKLTKSVLSEDRLQDVRKANLQEVVIDGIGKLSDDLYDEDPKKAKAAFDALTDLIEKSGKLKDGQSAQTVAKAIKELNSIKTKGGLDLFERIRDTALGNASTDMLGILASLGLLGGALVTAEDKAERKSTLINLGIPLLSALGFMVYGTAMCFSGVAALGIGFLTGEVAKRGAKALDNSLKKQAMLKAENQKTDIIA